MFGRFLWIEMKIIKTVLFQQNCKFDSNVHPLNSLIYFWNEISEECQLETVLTWGMEDAFSNSDPTILFESNVEEKWQKFLKHLGIQSSFFLI